MAEGLSFTCLLRRAGITFHRRGSGMGNSIPIHQMAKPTCFRHLNRSCGAAYQHGHFDVDRLPKISQCAYARRLLIWPVECQKRLG